MAYRKYFFSCEREMSQELTLLLLKSFPFFLLPVQILNFIPEAGRAEMPSVSHYHPWSHSLANTSSDSRVLFTASQCLTPLARAADILCVKIGLAGGTVWVCTVTTTQQQ